MKRKALVIAIVFISSLFLISNSTAVSINNAETFSNNSKNSFEKAIESEGIVQLGIIDLIEALIVFFQELSNLVNGISNIIESALDFINGIFEGVIENGEELTEFLVQIIYAIFDPLLTIVEIIAEIIG